LFHEAKEVGWMRWGAEVGPVGVLELCDLPHWFEGVLFVAEGESSYDYVRLVASFFVFAV
jgi:hypothetical protein